MSVVVVVLGPRGVACGSLVGHGARPRPGCSGWLPIVRVDQPCKVIGRLGAGVAALPEVDWSPHKIAAMLPNRYPGDDVMWMSDETIYQSLFVPTRGELIRSSAASTKACSSHWPNAPRGRAPGTFEHFAYRWRHSRPADRA